MHTPLSRPRHDASIARAIPDYKTAEKRQYLAQLDELQQLLYRRLLQAYGSETRSKLLTLKVSNLLWSEYHFRHRCARLASRPVQLLIDPANNCHLRCPGCVHSANPDWSAKFDWPDGLMSEADSERILGQFGPFACAAVLYNYGEPLLNKRFTEIVAAAKAFGLFTMTSTNLSLRIDADRLVGCGLDRLTVSADGATQGSYERFRRRGRLDIVLDNLAKIVEAKRQQASKTPYLVWQYLAFEHNVHDMGEALTLARKLGVNEIQFATPFSVAADDSSVRPAHTSVARQHVLRRLNNVVRDSNPVPMTHLAESRIDAAFQTSWHERWLESGGNEELSRAANRSCSWIYHTITIDAAGRVMPCCMAPAIGEKKLVYAHLDEQCAQLINSADAVQSRQHLAASGGDASASPNDPAARPFCLSCTTQPAPPYSFRVVDHICSLDTLGVVPAAVYEALDRATLYTTVDGNS